MLVDLVCQFTATPQKNMSVGSNSWVAVEIPLNLIMKIGLFDEGIGTSSARRRPGIMLACRIRKHLGGEFAHVSSDLVVVLTGTDMSSTIVEPDSRQTLLHRPGFVASS